LFGDLYNSDNLFKEIWNRVPKISAIEKGPLHFGKINIFKKLTTQNKLDIDNKITPLYKLTYKCDFPKYDKTKVIYYLYATIKT
jgi:hypothetical protein